MGAGKMADWDVLPAPENGDATREALYAAIGEALTEWERFAEGLAQIYSILIGAPELPPGQGSAIRKYGKLTFGPQCDKLEEAGKVFFRQHTADPTLQSKFDDLLVDCREFAKRRNDIAHGICEATASRGYLWLPPSYNPKKVQADWSTTYVYSSVEILTYAEHFRKLQSLADYFNRALYSVSH
jgi:hypothetical protein